MRGLLRTRALPHAQRPCGLGGDSSSRHTPRGSSLLHSAHAEVRLLARAPKAWPGGGLQRRRQRLPRMDRWLLARCGRRLLRMAGGCARPRAPSDLQVGAACDGSFLFSSSKLASFYATYYLRNGSLPLESLFVCVTLTISRETDCQSSEHQGTQATTFQNSLGQPGCTRSPPLASPAGRMGSVLGRVVLSGGLARVAPLASAVCAASRDMLQCTRAWWVLLEIGSVSLGASCPGNIKNG